MGLHIPRCVLSLILVVPSSALAQAKPSPVPHQGVLHITAALAGENLSVTPIPERRFTVTGGSDRASHDVVTSLAGEATISLPVGEYIIGTPTPVRFNGVGYSWSVTASIGNGTVTNVELSNTNAVTDSEPLGSARAGVTSDGLSDEQRAYDAARQSVFRVWSGLKRGTGFLVSASGLILTNAHVVAGDTIASVELDTMRTVAAAIVARDEDADVAVLRVSPLVVSHIRPLALAEAPDAHTPVVPGEHLLAIGYPRNQEQTLTAGIAGSVRDGAILSDVSITHGNSGGPLLTLEDTVVAINTFGDVQADGSPGVSGSILISRAFAVLASATSKLASAPPPDTALLQHWPRTAMPTQLVRALADSSDTEWYKRFQDVGDSRFSIAIITPVIRAVQAIAFEEDIARDRKVREDKANIADVSRFHEENPTDHTWNQYVGNTLTPIVMLQVTPRIGETGGSVLRRLIFTGVYGKQTLRFKGDVQSVDVYEDDSILVPIVSGIAPVQQYVNDRWIDLRDVANQGLEVFDPTDFAPDSTEAPPSIFVLVEDLKNPGMRDCKQVPPEVVAAMWNDFVDYYSQINPSEHYYRADPSVPRSNGTTRPADCI